MIKWISMLALSVAVVAGSVSAVVVFNKRESAARAAQRKAEAEESAAKEASRKALSEEKAERAKAEAAESAAKAAEQDRAAKEAEREAQKSAAEAAARQRAAAEAKRDEAEAEADRADADRDAAKARAAAARSEAEAAKRAAEAERARADAAAAALERERLASERTIAEARLVETRLADLLEMERELAAYRRDLDERERALRPDLTVKDLAGGAGADMVFDENGIARKVEKKPYLAENDLTLPKESRALARAERLVAEARAEREAAVRADVVSRILKLRDGALGRDDVVAADMYLKTLKTLYPDWSPDKENDKP